MTVFDRKIYPELKDHLKKKQVTVITGMRRTGKTTLLRLLLNDYAGQNKLYLDFERVDNRELFSEKNYDNIIDSLSQRGLDFKKNVCLALDEVQLLKTLPSVVKYLYDNYKIKFILSGSSSYYLKNLFSESLAGRKKIFELYPLDFGEFLTFKKVFWKALDNFDHPFSASEYERLRRYYEEFIEFGGFPEVVLEKSRETKKDILLDILSSYVNIDIKALADFRDNDNLYNLIKLLGQRTGTRLDYKKLSSVAGISRQTLHNYIDFFEKSYLVARLSVVANNPDKEIVKAKKIYFLDNGLVNVIAGLSSGAKFENAVFTQFHHFGKLSYYAKKTGQEIDFILNNEQAFEVKETPGTTDIRNLERLARNLQIKKCRLIGRQPDRQSTDFLWGGEIR